MLTTNLALALGHHQAGRFDEAERLYRTSLVQTPDDPSAWYLLGVLARQSGQHSVAISHLSAAIELRPDWAEARFNLGLAHEHLGQWDLAAAAYRHAIQYLPAFAAAYERLAMLLRQQGDCEAAIAAYRRFLTLKPNSAAAYNDLGELLANQQKSAEAIACFEQAATLLPDSAEIQNNIGNAYRDQGNKPKAIAAFARAVVLKPDLDATHAGLGSVFQENGELDKAAACFRHALQLNPNNAFAWNNLGNVLKAQGQIESALDSFRDALAINPDFRCAHSNLIYALYFAPGISAATIYEAHRLWNERFAAPLLRNVAPHANDRAPNRRLRIGYFSADFRDHVTSFFTLPLFTAHDREQHEILCYSSCRSPDYLTNEFHRQADTWREISALNDEQAAALIRSDRIDILVDLTMHLAAGRPLIFAKKPAPVQICWAAYPGTTGLTAVDYRLTDPYLDPKGLDDRNYSEESIRLENTFWSYDPRSTSPEPGPSPCASNGCITFGSLNNFCKVNHEVLQLWSRVLSSVPHSRLLMLSPAGSHRNDAWQLFQREGISRDRITFAGLRPREDYLALYRDIDICLDTFPYNGHTTTLDALWMGVPVVTQVGNTVVGRAGLSQLTNLGLTELIARTPEEYIAIARNLAGDLPRLTNLRATLRDRLQRSPLMDTTRFARNVEAIYRNLWQRYCFKN